MYRRTGNKGIRNTICGLAVLFTAYMVIGRTVAGVHWLTDIIGSVLLSSGLYLIYHGSVKVIDEKENGRRSDNGIS